MKLIYIYSGAGIKPNSIQNKILCQIKALNKVGVDCFGLFFTTEDIAFECQEYKFINIPKLNKKVIFRSLKQRELYQKSINEYFESNKPDFDYLYIRYPGSGRSLLKFSKMFKKRFIFEHVTKEIEEINLYKKENPLKLNISSILGNLEFRFFPILKERLYGSYIRRRAKFAICNSTEIAEYENRIEGGNYITTVGGDAVEVETIVAAVRPILNKELRMIFLKGASTNADFNGLDRIFCGIREYTGEYQLKLNIYGKNTAYERELVTKLGIEKMVHIEDFIDHSMIEEIMKTIHLGLGAFGVHRKGMISTTTIKTREYFARGVPFIYGHSDPDFSNNLEAKRYCLEFPANDSPIDFNQVFEWYKNLTQDSSYVLGMRSFATSNLDYLIKMLKLRNFIENR